MRICMVTTSFIRSQNDYYSRFVFEQAKSLLNRDGQEEVVVVAPHAPGLRSSEVIDGLQVFRFRYFWPPSWQVLAY